MAIENVYLGNDNFIDLILKSEDDDGIAQPQDLEPVTLMKLNFPELELTIESNNEETDLIKWDKEDYDVGEVRLYLGEATGLVPRHTPYAAYLIAYDFTNDDGIVWGDLLIKVNELEL